MIWSGRRGDDTADATMTLAGYFNSLRELGGMHRLVEDEVVSRCLKQSERCPEGADRRRWFADRRLAPEPVELTSREPTGRIAETKARLDLRHDQGVEGARLRRDGQVDVLLASNMISVGVDISRLGLMVVAGQPKEKDLTQIQLASLLGSSQSRVAKVEAADTSVSLDLLIRSLLAMGASNRELARYIAGE